MPSFLAVLAALILLPIGALHLLWATGVSWPFRSEAHLARSVIGTPFDLPRPRKVALTLMAAGAILMAGLIPLAVGGLLETGVPDPLLRWALMAEAGVFVLRGGYGYSPFMERAAPLEPFRPLNRRVFNPLILGLGAICVALLALT
ncbi:DUF3995 domain-containing protein [Dinoroseobacter sp. S375]|uniref:DUF3995 domain-containing protein n=1 Tax=Dinoroseobacter sp. S375 TaxID=3415136 RepID=UPI003C7EA8E6